MISELEKVTNAPTCLQGWLESEVGGGVPVAAGRK